jgi:hypothetical protein
MKLTLMLVLMVVAVYAGTASATFGMTYHETTELMNKVDLETVFKQGVGNAKLIYGEGKFDPSDPSQTRDLSWASSDYEQYKDYILPAYLYSTKPAKSCVLVELKYDDVKKETRVTVETLWRVQSGHGWVKAQSNGKWEENYINLLVKYCKAHHIPARVELSPGIY